ncbi:uncharacterized protein LOC119164175 isoform X3 [Rhipicephalus microplus]|uniref:uncharacterized protein LOC119164175 isoform X3 n=1 Tax=Rhipicephalus microplus TaxID=6941 RepID=UPI003F6D774E
MRKDVQYRDLPGGPLMIKFADELPLCTLCSRCGMLSKDMFEDPSSHAFCSVCIFECSDRKKIHCKYENKDVSVDEMMPAIDILNIVMDQVVYCPNTREGDSCREHCSLKDLEGHLLKCEKTEVICLSCGDSVKGVDWQDHVTSCPQHVVQCRHCVVAVPRGRLEHHERVCSSNPNAIREVDSCSSTNADSVAWSRSNSVPNHEKISVSQNRNEHRLTPEARDKARANTEAVRRSTPSAVNNVGGVVIESCPLCKRNVKSTNMAKHYSICQQRMASLDHDEANQTPGISVQPSMRETVPTKEPIREYTGNPHEGYSTPESRKVSLPQGHHSGEHAGPSQEAGGIKVPVQIYPDLQHQACHTAALAAPQYVQPQHEMPFPPFRAVAAMAPMPPVAPGRRPDHHAPINQGFIDSAPVGRDSQHPVPVVPLFTENHFGRGGQHNQLHASCRQDCSLASAANDRAHSKQRASGPPTSSMVYCPQLQMHRRVDEVATPASEDYDLLSDLEDLSISGGPNEHGQHVAPQQGGGYDQPAASSSTETQSSQPQQAQTEESGTSSTASTWLSWVSLSRICDGVAEYIHLPQLPPFVQETLFGYLS